MHSFRRPAPSTPSPRPGRPGLSGRSGRAVGRRYGTDTARESRTALARSPAIAVEAARARIRRGQELKRGREIDGGASTGDGHEPFLQGLAERRDDCGKLASSSRNNDPRWASDTRREPDCHFAAADQGRLGRRVMGHERAESSPGPGRRPAAAQIIAAPLLLHLERRRMPTIRHQHGLARPWRPMHEQMVPARRRRRPRLVSPSAAPDVCEVGHLPRACKHWAGRLDIS